MTVNLRGPFLMAHEVVPRMLQRGRGRILETASGLGIHPFPDYSAYSVSKAAQLRWVDNLADALADTALRVVAVSPGLVRTDMTRDMFADKPADAWGSVEPFVQVVRRFAAGDLDTLHGWFVHVRDDVDALVAEASGAGQDARRLRLAPPALP